MTGDFIFKWDPPFPTDDPLIPQPVIPVINPWELERLREYYDLLKKIKELEDQLVCPCEPNKADYIGVLRKRIEELEQKAK